MELEARERGRIAFAVRPRVEGAPGVQRFVMLLSPDESDIGRRVVVGRKRMPAPGAKEREWAYVDRLGGSRSELLADLGPRTYMTKTRGERHQPGARVIAEGRYAIIGHDDHAHLTYALDRSDELGPVHDALKLRASGSVIAAVFNPLARWNARRQPELPHVDEGEGAPPWNEPSIYPDELQERFGDKRFAPLDPAFLDYEGAELVLIGAEDDVRPELALAV
jgi:hypothetical protein